MTDHNELTALLQEMEYVANHPGRMINQWKKETGRPVVGCLPIHSIGAEELIHAAGMLPVGLWGGQTAFTRSGEYLQAFCCSIMKAVVEYALIGVYQDLSAVISPNTCDTMRCIPLLLKEINPNCPVIGLVLPDNRKIDAGVEYMQAEFKQVALELEKIAGKEITVEKLQESIELYNAHRQLMNEFYDLAYRHLDVITPYYRHMIVKSSFFVPREQHYEWMQQLNALLKAAPEFDFQGGKVVITGIMAEPVGLLKMLEEFNLAVVADEMAQGSRQFRTLVPAGADPYKRLAERFALFEGCATVYDPVKQRGLLIRDMVKKYDADGVIVLMLKFCDPEEYDYPFIKKDLDDAGISSLYVEIEQQMDSLEQIRTRLQAFQEILVQRSVSSN